MWRKTTKTCSSFYLGNWIFSVTTSWLQETVLEAVALALSQHPDVIVMDILMPEMDGLEAVSLIRDNPKTREIPILATTAWVDFSSSRDKYLKSGFDGYIAKPFTLRDFQNAIGKLLRDSPEGSVTGEQLVDSMDQSNAIAPAVSAKPIF